MEAKLSEFPIGGDDMSQDCSMLFILSFSFSCSLSLNLRSFWFGWDEGDINPLAESSVKNIFSGWDAILGISKFSSSGWEGTLFNEFGDLLFRVLSDAGFDTTLDFSDLTDFCLATPGEPAAFPFSSLVFEAFAFSLPVSLPPSFFSFSLSFFFDFFVFWQHVQVPSTRQGQSLSWGAFEFVFLEQLHVTWEFLILLCSLQNGHCVEGLPFGLIIISGWSVWVHVVTLWPLIQRSQAYLTPLIRTMMRKRDVDFGL